MEQLRIIPLGMFFVGALLMYAGFSGQRPSDIVRNALQNNSYTPYEEDLYAADRNPIYAGVKTYERPPRYTDRGYFS